MQIWKKNINLQKEKYTYKDCGNLATKEMRLKHRDLKTKTRWDDTPDREIVNHVIKAAKVGCILLYKWETEMVAPDQNKMKIRAPRHSA